MKLILASSSKRRKDIFDMIGLKYDVVISDEKESSNKTNPEEYVKEISLIKANNVSEKVKEKAIIIAADTVIYMNGKIYGKPKDKEDAYNSIKEMSGNNTYAYTGITIKDLYQNKTLTFYDKCEVELDVVSDEEIKWYVENEIDILQIAGYAMFGKASLFLKEVRGDYNTLFGLSPNKLYKKLKELGYKLSDFELK